MKIKHFSSSQTTVSIVITVFLAYFLLRQIHFDSIFGLFGVINYSYLLFCFILVLLMTLVRAIRIKLLLNNSKADLKLLFALVLENNFLVNILPFRTGDLTFPVLMNKYAGISKKEGLLMLFYLRILDTYIILIFLLVSVLLFSNNILNLSAAALFIVVLILISLAVLFFRAEKMLLFLRNTSQKKSNLRYANSLEGNLGKIMSAYKFYRSTVFTVFFLSFLIFIAMVFAMGAALKAYPIDLSYLDVMFFSLMIIVITSLPINGIAGIGTVELGISSFLMSTGVGRDLSISIAFNYHFITLMIMMTCAGFGHIYLLGKKHNFELD